MSTTDERPAPDADTPAQMAPGAPDALAAGCTCPAWINTFGEGIRTAPGAFDPDQHLAHPDCRLHGVEPL